MWGYKMICILWIIALFVTAGAQDEEAWKRDMINFFESISLDLDAALKHSKDVSTSTIAPDSPYVTSRQPGSGYPATDSVSPVRPVIKETTPSSVYATTASVSTAYPGNQPPSSTTEGPLNGNEDSSESYPIQVGSIRGIPGVNFPDYTDIPITSFTCSDKSFVPGFYADMETGCQVFHVCWPHRRESFLCPLGTTFNQAILACDYWYSTNCSLAHHYYEVNEHSVQAEISDSEKDTNLDSMIDDLFESGQVASSAGQSEDCSKISGKSDCALSFLSQFLPVKAKVVVYPETTDTRSKIVAEASVGLNKKRDVYRKATEISTEGPVYTSAQPSSWDDYRTHHKMTGISKEEPKYTPDQTSAFLRPQYIAVEPEESKQKYVRVEEATVIILDEVLNTVKNILREAQGLLPVLHAAQKVHDTTYVKKPLTKLNQRFITKPVLPKKENKRYDFSSTTEAVTVSSPPKHPATVKPPQKTVVTKPYQHRGLNVSPMTKKALAANYLRLLKIKRS